MNFARPAPRNRPQLLLVLVATLCGACSKDRLKAALSATPPADIDYAWTRDSSVMANQPDLLFRVVETKTGSQVVPIGTIGRQGFEMLTMGNRGWHFFDLTYLHQGSSLRAIRGGRSVADIPLMRGHWESGKPSLDTVPGCTVVVPGGLVSLPAGVRLLTTATHQPLPSAQSLGADELREALDRAYKLVVPSAGVSLAMQGRYTKEVYQVESGVGPMPTLVVILDDPEIVPDDVPAEGQRPRHVVLVLDNARFGYKVTYRYSTLGNLRAPPRYKWLDFVDVDGDNKGELLFGLRDAFYLQTRPTYTIGLRFKNDVWTQSFANSGTRCQG